MKPISTTAFYCSGLRMHDAERNRPICNDVYAKTFMDDRGMEIINRFGDEYSAVAGHAARHRYIDDYLRSKLAANPKLRIFLLGCGFDSRAYRLTGGEWIELDEPELMTYKNEKLPAQSCSNKLHRIPIEFATDSLAEKLARFASEQPAIFVIEGVTMYLATEALERSLKIVRDLFPNHEVIADLVTPRFLDTFGKNIKKVIAAMGADMIPVEDPATPFVRTGYRQMSSESVSRMTLVHQGVGFLSWPFKLLVPHMINGYTIRVFA